jgi:hypothetical protein
MGQKQGQQINIPGERAANSVATEKQSASSPSQQSASRAQSRLGNAAVQERMDAGMEMPSTAAETEQETGGVAAAGTEQETGGVAAAASGGMKAASAPPPATKEHYKVEMKAWIPHDKVVDPEEPARVSDWLQSIDDIVDSVPGTGLIANPEYEYHSYYRGDNHDGYGGSYRVLSVIEFDWDGKSISNVTGTGDYGASHRDWDARAWVETLLGDIPLGSDSGSESARATSATSKSGGGNTFSLGIASANPLVLTWAPNINANLTGTIARDGRLTLDYSTDFFPSHGVQVSRNGKAIHTAITNNASGVNALGAVGAVNVGARLMNQGNSGGAVLPGGGVKGKVR